MSRSARNVLVAAVAIVLTSWTMSASRADVDDGAPLSLDSPMRKKGPAVPAEPNFSLPQIHSAVLDNGVRLVFVERHELPIVSVRVLATRGVADAPPGVASFASDAFFLGTAARSPSDISASFQRIGVNVESGLSYDAVWVDSEVLSVRLGGVLSLVADLFQHSRVPDVPFEIQRTRSVARVTAAAGSPHVIMQSAVATALYPASHPYRETLAGDERIIKAVTRDQVVSFFQTQVRPDTTVVVVAGDVDRFRLEAMVHDAFDGWKGKAAVRLPVPEVTRSPASPRVVLVDRWGGTQATINVVQTGVGAGCPDRDALLVINAILGSISGRFSKSLRGAKGTTYDAHTSFGMGRGPRPFVVSTSVAPERVGEVAAFILSEVRRITTEPVTDDELAYGKAVVRGALPLRFTSLRGTVQALSEMAASDQPLQDHAALTQKLAALTPETLLRVAKMYLRPDELRVMVVARAKTVRDQLKALGLGTVQVLSAVRGEETSGAIPTEVP